MKDLLNFDTKGRPRTADEIADLCADAPIAFNLDGSLRTAAEIEKIKFMSVLAKHPQYISWIKSAQERKADEFLAKIELTHIVPTPNYEPVVVYK